MTIFRERLPVLKRNKSSLFSRRYPFWPDENEWESFSKYPYFDEEDQRIQRMGWIPSMDISETEKEIKVKTDMPGVNPNDINIEVDDEALVVSGKTEDESEEEGENWYRLERNSGSFRRAIGLPKNIDKNSITANLKNGILDIRIPKKPSDTRRKIELGQ